MTVQVAGSRRTNCVVDRQIGSRGPLRSLGGINCPPEATSCCPSGTSSTRSKQGECSARTGSTPHPTSSTPHGTGFTPYRTSFIQCATGWFPSGTCSTSTATGSMRDAVNFRWRGVDSCPSPIHCCRSAMAAGPASISVSEAVRARCLHRGQRRGPVRNFVCKAWDNQQGDQMPRKKEPVLQRRDDGMRAASRRSAAVGERLSPATSSPSPMTAFR